MKKIVFCELFRPKLMILYLIRRKCTENRHRNKASKRNIEFSTSLILNEDSNYRLVSNDGELPFDNYIKIDNSNLEPDVVAKMINDKFSL